MAEEKIVPHYTRNLIAFTGDTVAFIVGASFVDSTTVLPTFASHLTSSAPLIGLISTMQSGGWLLPQLISANYVANKERKKPYVVWPCLIGRPIYLLMAAVAFFYGGTRPLLTLLTLYLVQGVFYLCDGLGSVPWFDVLSKAIPGRRRGRYLGVSQVLGGILAIGAGAAVRRILNPETGLPFPQSYSLLFLIALGFFAVSFIFLNLIKEPVESTHAERVSWGRYLPMLWATLRDDRPFRRVVAARLIAGFGGMATPFFILFGTEGLRLGPAIVGTCLTAQILGRIVGGVLLGVGVEKLGNRITLLGALGVTCCAPLLAFAVSVLHPLLDLSLLPLLYPVAFFFLGFSMNTMMWGFTNYVLDMAPPKDRPTYVGLTNTLSGVLILAPILGGTILQLTSYSLLFAVSLVIYLAALALAWQLPTRQEQFTAATELTGAPTS